MTTVIYIDTKIGCFVTLKNAWVAAAIMNALFGDDWEVFDNPKYVPNMTCYRTVLDAFFFEEKSERSDWQLSQKRDGAVPAVRVY